MFITAVRGGFVIQRHNELRDLQAEMLRMVCNGVETEPVLQDITGEELNRGANTASDARLDIVARGFWERQRSAFFDVRICHPNADSYRDMELNQIYRQHETEKKRQYASRVLEVEQATFTPLVFSTTGGMAAECKRYHIRLAESLATKKGESYATNMSWIRARLSFALLRSALLCLRGSRAEFDIEKGHANIRWKHWGRYFISFFLIVFLSRFPYLKLISYILLSYSVFAISMLILRDWNFHATNTVMFLRFYYKYHWRKMFSIFVLKQVNSFKLIKILM